MTTSPDRPSAAGEGIAAFLVRPRRPRCIEFLANPRKRRKFLDSLYHFADFDPRVVVPLPHSAHTTAGVLRELRARGAGRTCTVVSVHEELDGKTLDLAETLDRVVADRDGTIVVCIPDRLAWFEGEPPSYRFILDARARK